MAAILNSANFIQPLPSWIQTPCFSSLRITLKHSESTLTLTQTNSIWLKFIHSDSTWWWQPSWILSCWILTLPSCIETTCFLLSDSLKNTLHSNLTLTQTNSIWLKLIHSHLTWWWQPSWFLPSWIQTLHLGFRHLVIFLSDSLKPLFKIHSWHLDKKTSLIHSDSTWWWQPSWTLPTWIPPFWIQPS